MISEEQRNIDIIRTAYGEMMKGNTEAFYSIMTDETEFHEAPSLPYAGTYRGRAQVERGINKMFRSWDDFSFQLLQYGAGGDLVFVHVMISGVGRKTGKSFSMPIVEMWRLKDGKVTEVRPFYFDTTRCVECFG